jgi:hypothetical protein
MRLRAFVLAAFIVLAAAGFAGPRLAPTAEGSPSTAAQWRAQQRRPRGVSRGARADYANFSHATAEHRRACDSCHKFPSKNWKDVRKGDAAFADITEYPEHSSCLDCHRPQFFARERPQPKICSVCHVNVTPRNTVRWPFPALGDAYDATPRGHTAVSDFAVNFPHAKHEGLFSGLRHDSDKAHGFVRASFTRQDDPAKANAPCATCHQTFKPQGDSEDEFVTRPPKDLPEGAFWLKKGAFKTTPRDHATCFTCHSAEAGIAPAQTDCATCHKLLPPERRLSLTGAHDDFDPKLAAAMGVADRATLRKWAGREAARFRHEWPPHDLACTACHNVSAMDTADEATRRVPVMSCGGEGTGCHIEQTPDGTLNMEIAQRAANPRFECVRCHVANGRQPVPATHAAALPASTKK